LPISSAPVESVSVWLIALSFNAGESGWSVSSLCLVGPALDLGRRVPPRSDRHVGQPRRGETAEAVGVAAGASASDVAVDGAEAFAFGLPLLTEGHDLLIGPADEVPPHDDLLGAGLTAERNQSGRLAWPVGDAQLGRAHSGVAERARRHNDVLEFDLTGV